MKTLPRYLLGRFLAALAVFLLGLLALFTAVELFELREHYAANAESLAALGEYLALRAPFLIYLALPVALVLAIISVIAARAHGSEIIAAQAGGIPLLRLAAPILLVASGLGALLLAGAEYRVPGWSDRADYLRRVVIQKKHAPRAEYHDVAFLHEGHYVVADRFEPTEGILEAVFVIIPSADGATGSIEGTWPLLRFQDNGWQAPGARPPASRADDVLRAIPPPRHIELLAPSGGVRVLADKPIEALSLSTLWRERRDIAELAHRRSGDGRLRGEITERLVKIQAKLALPFSVPLLALISVCLGARVGRRQGMGAAIGSALMTSLGFMLLLQTATNMGTFAARSPALQGAAPYFPWLTPFLLVVIALALVKRSRFAN